MIKKTVPFESQEQINFVHWFRLQFKKVLILHVPNGEIRAKRTANKLKAMGVVSGVPDLFIPEWQLWIEMKRVKGGSLSLKQKEILKYLEACGYSTIIGRGTEDASIQVLKFLKEATNGINP